MSDARQAIKESMLVAADQYEADGEWWRADALRALARGDVLEVEVMPRSYGSREMMVRLRCRAQECAVADLKATVTITARDLPQVREEMERAQAEIARLRGLIKEAEWEGVYGYDSDACCPWCRAYEHDYHLDTCPAFTPDGAVR